MGLAGAAHALPEDARTGTRSLGRALRLLKELSSRGEFGWRLIDIAEEVGLDTATCHRMLTCFVKEGFAERGTGDLKYYPGPALFEMGLAVPQYAALCAQVDLRLEQVAARTGCIASFSLRSGNDMVCVAQRRASLEIAGMLIRVGTRRPIVTSVAGLAVLQKLPPDVKAAILAENHQREFGRGGERRLKKLECMRLRGEQHGFAFTLGDLAPGIGAVAVSVHAASGEPIGGVFLTGQDTVLNEATVGRFHQLLAQEAEVIQEDVTRHLRRMHKAASA